MQVVPGPAFQPVRKTRMSGHIILQVQDLLASGRLKPGDRLPAERELAQVLGVGRTTVREAIRSLEYLGLVLVRPGRGTILVESGPSSAPPFDP